MNNITLYILISVSYLLPSQLLCKDTLTLNSFLDVVISNHPLIKKAQLFDENQIAFDLKGKGALDPKVASNYQTKDFDNKDYFTLWQTEVKVPTTLPVDFSLGYERNEGLFLNDENNLPSNGLIYGTFNINLLRGLLFDEQRFKIRKAKLDGINSEIEKEILIREILNQAIKTYIKWVETSNNLTLSENYLDIINERHLNIIELYLNGDIPAIDTTESRLNLYSAKKIVLKAEEKLVIRQQELSLFIWDDDGTPLMLQNQIYPMKFEELIDEIKKLSLLVNPNFIQDPLVRKIENKIASLELVNKLEKEQLKPQLNLKYNTVVSLGEDAIDPLYSFSNYKYGLSFEYPIRNRKTRGEIKLNEILIDQNNLDKIQYLANLKNKFEALLARLEIQAELIIVSENKIESSLMLYEAEQIKFNLGESSIFILNQREKKLLESQMELVKVFESTGQIFNQLYYLKQGQFNN